MGISFDTVEDNAAFAKKFEFNFPLLCDTSRTAGVAYGACEDQTASSAKRISYLIDEQGRIEKAYPKVDTTKHPAEVLADL